MNHSFVVVAYLGARHGLREQHPAHGFRRRDDSFDEHAIEERSKRASGRHRMNLFLCHPSTSDE